MSATTTPQPTGPQRTVHVRIGTYRTAYHPSITCSALNGKQATYSGQEEMTEGQAQQLGLHPCALCPPVLPMPVEGVFADLPMYDVPNDYRQTPRVFTVTVAGPERHDGQRPTAYLVEAYTTEQAWAKVLGWYMVEHETVDAYVVAGESFEGAPHQGRHAHDLRSEFARQEALDDLADQAAELVEKTTEETAALAEGAELEEAIGEAAFTAWPLVLQLAQNDGR